MLLKDTCLGILGLDDVIFRQKFLMNQLMLFNYVLPLFVVYWRAF